VLGEPAEGEEVVGMQDPPNIEDVLKELDLAEELVNTFAVRAKRYWMGWGPVVGMPMILSIEAWAEGQLKYLKWLRAGVLEL
jgi:hypothetical protein